MKMADISENIGAVLYGPQNLKLEKLAVPDVGDNEVQVAVAQVGICGSDVHFYMHGSLSGMFPLTRAIAMGHEFGGRVVRVGKNVEHLKVGDRVAVEPGVGCRACEFCHIGRYNLCPNERFFATTCHGSLQNFVNFDSDFCYKIPDSVSDEEAALVEPVAVGVCAIRKAQVQTGMVSVIHGAGPVGLCLYMVAKATGCCKTVFTDINQARLDFAKSMGDDVETVLISPESSNNNVKPAFDNPNSLARTLARRIVAAAGCEPNIAFDTTGVELLQQASIFSLQRGGVLMLIGYHHELNLLPVIDMICKEIDIRSIFRYSNTYQAAVDLVASKRLIGLERMVTHRFPLSQVVNAFETASNALTTGAIKVMVDCNAK